MILLDGLNIRFELEFILFCFIYFRQLTKSFGVFIVGIYLAKDISSVKIFENA